MVLPPRTIMAPRMIDRKPARPVSVSWEPVCANGVSAVAVEPSPPSAPPGGAPAGAPGVGAPDAGVLAVTRGRLPVPVAMALPGPAPVVPPDAVVPPVVPGRVVTVRGESVVEVAEVVATVVELVAPGSVVDVLAGGCVVDVVVELVVAPGARKAQLPLVTLFVSRVTAPLRASSRPSTLAPVFAVIDVRARIVPAKTELVPSTAELPICQ